MRERIDRRGALIAGIAAGLSLAPLRAVAAAAPGEAANPRAPDPLPAQGDHVIIVGAGSAGCVLANRLSVESTTALGASGRRLSRSA